MLMLGWSVRVGFVPSSAIALARHVSVCGSSDMVGLSHKRASRTYSRVDQGATQARTPDCANGTDRRFPTANRLYNHSIAVAAPWEVHSVIRTALITFVVLAVPGVAEEPKESAKPKSRSFDFTYETTVTGLKPGETARIWLPVASSSSDQTVEIVEKMVPPTARIETEPKHQNRILYSEAKADDNGNIPLRVVYRVTRKEV